MFGLPKNAYILSILAIAALAPAYQAHAQTVVASSTFDVDTDGWSPDTTWNMRGSWQSAGGNTGGYLGGRTFLPFVSPYFDAPSKFLGNQSGSFGYDLSFDIRETTGHGDPGEVWLISNAGTLINDFGYLPSDWTNVDLKLGPGAGWNNSDGTVATGPQIEAALSDLNTLLIGDNYIPAFGRRFGLDNVRLTAVPEPGVTGLLAGLTAPGLYLLAKRRSKRTLG